LIITAATFSIVYRKQIVELAIKYKFSAIFWNRSQVAEGGLISLGPDSADMHRRSASYVDRILKGEKPAHLRVQEPTKVELIISAKMLLARADVVVE
jgi:putative ABC transport system substrate-binding protein